MNILVKRMRDRPVNSLMMIRGVAPQPRIDSVWQGSLLGGHLDGRLDYSLGKEMAVGAPSLHPVFGMAL